jgi:hypothetical protein
MFLWERKPRLLPPDDFLGTLSSFKISSPEFFLPEISLVSSGPLYFIVGNPVASSSGVADASISAVGTFDFFFASSHAGLFASQ